MSGDNVLSFPGRTRDVGRIVDMAQLFAQLPATLQAAHVAVVRYHLEHPEFDFTGSQNGGTEMLLIMETAEVLVDRILDGGER